MSGDWRAEVRGRLADSVVTFDAPMARAVPLRVGGPAECLVELQSERDLEAVFEIIAERQLPFHVLGKGSNVLVRDEGLRGLVLRLGPAFRSVRRLENSATVEAGAGISNGAFVDQCRRWQLGGMEFLVAVPGSIGGAIAMNAGAHDGETAAFLRTVRVFFPRTGISDREAAEFQFAYRESPLRGNLGRMVLRGAFALQRLAEEEIRGRQQRILQWRKEHQPSDFPNCGSVFKNPPGDFAARLIDRAGLKGHTRGGAQISEKHANFIVNRGGATADEVLALVDFIQETVYSRNGVMLELEMQVFPLETVSLG